MGPAELWSIISRSVRRLSQKTLGDARFRGPHQYSIWIVVRIFLLCQLEGTSAGVVYERLKEVRGYRRRYQLPNQLISYSQYKKRLKTSAFYLALNELLRYCAQVTLRQLGESETEVVMTDLTSIHSDPRKDLRGAWGYDSKGLLYGYKLGLITSAHGVILGMSLMKANWTEPKVERRLQESARQVIQGAHRQVQVGYLLADAGFDSEKTCRHARRLLHAKALIPAKRKRDPARKTARRILHRAKTSTPYRYAAQELWKDPASKAIARRRSEIERVNAQLKSAPFRIQEIPRHSKGVLRLRRLILGKLLIYNFALNANALRSAPLRGIRGMVA